MDPQLPFEILLEIAEYFDPFTWQSGQLESCEIELGGPDFRAWHREVLSLSLVSKGWHAAFNPLIKGLIHIREESVEDLRCHLMHCLSSPGDLGQFHTISLPESLVLYDAKGWLPIVNSFEKASEAAKRVSVETTWLCALTKQRKPSGSAASDQLLAILSAECIEAEIALLLSLLSGLRNIHIRLRSDGGIKHFKSILHLFARAKQDATLLPSLRRVVLSWTPEFSSDYGYRPMGIEHILALPKVREIDAAGFWSLYTDYDFFIDRRTRAQIPGNSSKVQHLTLRSWQGNWSVLRQITGACEKLRSFEVHFDATGDTLAMEADDVISALGKHKDSLERIILKSVAGMFADDNIHIMPLGSLKSFKVLRHLDLPLFLLVGSPAQRSSQKLEPDVTQHDNFEDLMESYLQGCARFHAKSGGDLQATLWSLLTDVFPPTLRTLRLRKYGTESELATCWFKDFHEHVDSRLPERRETWKWHAGVDCDDPEMQDLQYARGRKLVHRLGLSRTIAEAYDDSIIGNNAAS